MTEKSHSVYRIMETEDHTVLDNALEMHFFNLSMAREDETLGELRQWLIFIQTDDRKERAKMANGNPALEKANQVMERLGNLFPAAPFWCPFLLSAIYPCALIAYSSITRI